MASRFTEIAAGLMSPAVEDVMGEAVRFLPYRASGGVFAPAPDAARQIVSCPAIILEDMGQAQRAGTQAAADRADIASGQAEIQVSARHFPENPPVAGDLIEPVPATDFAWRIVGPADRHGDMLVFRALREAT